MGWSCRADAAKTMDRITLACVGRTNSQNTWRDDKGNQWFWEISRREHDDGAITGGIFRMLPNNFASACGSFRIEGSGEVSRGPVWFKKLGQNK